MSKQNRIFIIGNSGAGKGVLAQTVAKKLGWKFINADVFGCAGHIGRTMSEVIGQEGEHAMNQCLTEILAHNISQENIVVTTDENIVADEKARELLQSEFTVHLDVSISVQLERLASSHYRPLLPVNDFEAFIEKFREEKDNLYHQVASFSLSSDDGNIEAHAENIIRAFEKR
jgi:shikimate kinase